MIKPIIGIAVIMILLLFPMKNNVTINKSRIDSNKPFAGTINGELVGTDICVKYWLHSRYQPDIATYHVVYPLGLSVFGYIYKAEKI